MIARVSAIQIRKEKEERAIEIIKGVLSEAETVKGYRGAQFLTDSDTDKGYVISYWDSKEDAIAKIFSRSYPNVRCPFHIEI